MFDRGATTVLARDREVVSSAGPCDEGCRGASAGFLRFLSLLILIGVTLTCLPAMAQRDPVLKQIDLPHRYYYREMYLPQLTTGPSAAAWMPDSRSLVYSMAGSSWRQDAVSERAAVVPVGAGYDYQPDCSSDGRGVVYVKYDKDAMELWALDLKSANQSLVNQNAAKV